MIPLSFTLERALAYPAANRRHPGKQLRSADDRLAVAGEGHTILFHDVRLGVAEACSGLSMLVIFLALFTAVAITIRRPLLDRVVVLLSAVPVAVLAPT